MTDEIMFIFAGGGNAGRVIRTLPLKAVTYCATDRKYAYPENNCLEHTVFGIE
ncbi:MAG: hypothetical protein QCH31_01245 [Methanolobus sp.]|nr:hypothetical protein [Methanolobus sp.]